MATTHPADRYIDPTGMGEYQVLLAGDDGEIRDYQFTSIWAARQFVAEEVLEPAAAAAERAKRLGHSTADFRS
jgi:hypothetical protein